MHSGFGGRVKHVLGADVTHVEFVWAQIADEYHEQAAKRERKKANRQIRLEQLQREQRVRKAKRRGLQFGIIVPVAVLILVLIIVAVNAGDNNDDAGSTTSPASTDAPPQVIEKQVRWDAAGTAIVICDMWDKHHCPDATERVGEMAPRMNEVLKAARSKGVFIIHCPSDTMGFYKDHPGRKLAQAAPKVETKVPLQGWCSLNGVKEPALPIDDSEAVSLEPSDHHVETVRPEVDGGVVSSDGAGPVA